MLKISPSYRLPLGVSIFFHIILLIVLTINLSSSNTYRLHNPLPSVASIKDIKAETVSQTVIDNEINAMKIAEKHKAEQARNQGLKEKVQVLKKQKIAQKKRLMDFHMKQLHIKQQKKKEMIAKKKGISFQKTAEN